MRTKVMGVIVAAVAAGSVVADEPKSAPEPVNRFLEGTIPRGKVPMEHVRPSFWNADLHHVAQAIAQMTDHEIVLAPEVCGQFTAAWEGTVSRDQLYEDFTGILRAIGYAVALQGSQTRIYLADAARTGTRDTCRNYPPD